MKSMENKERFDSLFRDTYSRLYFYARRILGVDSDAEDVVEEVFCELWSHIDDVETGERIQAFLYRAVFNRSLNMLKRHGASRRRMEALSEINDLRLQHLESTYAGPQQDMENADLHRQLQAAIDELPEKCRRVFRLSYIDGKKNAEIADEMQTSLRTVEAHMYNALKYLRKRLGHLVVFLLTLLANY